MEKKSTLAQCAAFTQTEKKNTKELDSLPQPGKSVINNILNYSKALNVHKTKNCGFVRLVMN